MGLGAKVSRSSEQEPPFTRSHRGSLAEADVEEQSARQLDKALTDVMHRFRGSFLGEVVDLGESSVPFRQRTDFVAPLVTVLGHTYGMRLIVEGDGSPGEPVPAVEVSVNVYDDEFELDRFKAHLVEIYRWGNVLKLMENFSTPDDNAVLQHGLRLLTSVLFFHVDRDVDVVEKRKETPSNVTGRLVDTVLRVRYQLDAVYLNRLIEERALFVSWMYLYCLRPFCAAYRKSLTIDHVESHRP